MGKVTESAILAKLIRIIKRQFYEQHWQGLDITRVKEVEWVEPTLGNFKYEGCGEYTFSAHIRFLVKGINDESGEHSEIHEIYPPCKIYIEESKQDFDVAIASPTIITTRIQ